MEAARILHVIDVSGTGGAETVFCNLVRHFESLGQNASVVVPGPGWIAAQVFATGAPLRILPSKGAFSFPLLLGLIRLCRESRANTAIAHLLGSSVYVTILGALLRIPVVAVFHGAWDVHDPGRLGWLKKWLLQRSHVTIVAVSDAVRNALVRWGISSARVTVISNGVDTARFSLVDRRPIRDELGASVDTILIGAVGNLHPIKGYELLLETAAVLCATNTKVRFFVAGEGDIEYTEKLRSLRDRLGLAKRFEFLGFRPCSSELYCSMDVFVSTAESEGLPLSFLEAMACGIPIVATGNEGSRALLQSTKGGLLAVGRHAVELAEVLDRVSNDSELRASLGSKGRESVCSKFDFTRTLGSYQHLMERLVHGRGT